MKKAIISEQHLDPAVGRGGDVLRTEEQREKPSRRRIIVRIALLGCVLGLFAWCWMDICLWRADQLLKGRRHEEASTWVQRSRWLNHQPNAQVCLMQLRVARRRQDFAEVERKLQEAARLGAPRRELQRERLLAMAQTNQFHEMQGRWSELLNDPRDDGPDIARAYYTWAMLHHNVTLAEKTLKLWHEDYPQDSEPLVLAGLFYQATDNLEAAEESYQQALTLAPGDDKIRLSLANVLQTRLKTKEAIALFEEHLRRHPADVTALQGLAQCFAAIGEMESAVQTAKQALDSNPEDFATQKLYGELLLASGDATTAVTVLQQAHREVPEHANLTYSLAMALKQCGRSDEAEPLFAFVAEARPYLDKLLDLEAKLRKQTDNLQLRMEIADITARYVSQTDAIRWYENLLVVSPRYRPAHQALVELYRQVGKTERAQYHAAFVAQNPAPAKAPATGPLDTEPRTNNRQ